MPKLFPPGLVKNPDSLDFLVFGWLTDPDWLRPHLQDFVCLAVDVEGCEGIRGDVTSIGLAILPPTDFQAVPFPSPPFDTQQLVDQDRIESYCIYFEGRKRKKLHPPFPFGVSITTSDPAGEINAIVRRIQERYIDKDIVLVAWHPHARDLPAIKALVPSLLKELGACIDVLEVMGQTCSSKQENLAKTWPCLGDVMLSVGFAENFASQRYRHNAGSDAIDTVMVLARLLTLKPDEPRPEVRRRRGLKQWQRKRG